MLRPYKGNEGSRLEAGATKWESSKPGRVVQKTKNPNQMVGAEKTRRAGALH
jgi:hypothetical protein